MSKAIEKAHKLLDFFLATRNKADGSYAPFSEAEEEALHQLLIAIRDAKFTPDCDGDYPLEWDIVNRHRFERSHYVPLLYSHKAETVKELLEIVETAQMNADIANGRVSTLLRILKDQMKRSGLL